MDDSSDWVSTKLVERVQSLSKKTTLDTNIRGILEECLKNVEKQSVYLENGIFNFNLAEVAIVLEHVTLIYGKKVDLLWDKLLNYQKGLLKFNTQGHNTAAEQKQIEQCLEKYKRRRKKPIAKEDVSIKRLDIKSLLPQLSMEFNTDDTLTLKEQVWNDFAQFPTDIEEDPVDRYLRPFFVATSYPVHLNNEYLCDNAQISSNYYHFETCDFIRQAKYNFLGDREIGATGYDLEDELTQKFLVERNIKLINITEEQTKELNEYIEQQLLERLPLQQKCKRLCPRRSSIMLTRLSQDVMAKYLKKDRPSIEETLIDNQHLISNDSCISELDLNAANVNIENQQMTADVKNIQEINSEQVINSDNFDENVDVIRQSAVNNIDTNIQTNESDILNATNSNDNDKEEEDHGFIDDNTELGDIERDDKENRISNRTVEITIKRNKHEKRKSKVRITDDEVPIPKKRLCRKSDVTKLRKVITKPLEEFELFLFENYKPQSNEGLIVIDNFIRSIYLKQSQVLKIQNVITRSHKEYEMFYYKNYKPETEEGILIEPIFPEQSAGETDNDDHIPLSQDSGICEDIDTENEIAENSEYLDTIIGDNIGSNVITSTPIPDDKLNKPSTSKVKDTSIFEAFKLQQQANEKYFEWKKGVDKKLAATDKNDFDIHEYGTQILDMLPDKEPVKFNKLMKGRNSSEVARLFIASLQLINTSNIELLDNTPGRLANDTLQFQLLSRDRHHERLDSYMAPSLESKAVALKKIKNLQRSRASTSTNSSYLDELPHKRKKLT